MAPRRPTAPRPPSGSRPAAPSSPRQGASPRPAPRTPPSPPPRSPARAPARSPQASRRPGASRPAPAPGAGAARPVVAGPVPRGRAGRTPVVRPVTMMCGVFVILALLLAPYVRPWLAQRSQIAAGAEDIQRLQGDLARLESERARWNDPAYVEAQARLRLHYVKPGETGYVVIDDRPRPQRRIDPRAVDVAVPKGANAPWYGKVWQSVQIAGDDTTEQAHPTP